MSVRQSCNHRSCGHVLSSARFLGLPTASHTQNVMIHAGIWTCESEQPARLLPRLQESARILNFKCLTPVNLTTYRHMGVRRSCRRAGCCRGCRRASSRRRWATLSPQKPASVLPWSWTKATLQRSRASAPRCWRLHVPPQRREPQVGTLGIMNDLDAACHADTL